MANRPRSGSRGPSVTLADEPTGNLNTPRPRTNGRGCCAWWRMNGCSVIMVTHDPRIAAYADRVFFKDSSIVNETQLEQGEDTASADA